MTALAQHREAPMPAQVADRPDAFLAMIERAANSESFDISKMEKLVDMRNAELERVARVAFATDFALMQSKLPTIERNGRIEVRKKTASGERDGEVQQSSGYALWADIQEACKPHMQEHGFGISFEPRTTDEGKIIVTAILSHRGGHERRVECIPLQHDSTGSKNAVQAVGSSLSYGMRYAGIMALGIASKEHDDGKGGASPSGVISEDQANEIEILIGHAQANKDAFLKWIGAPTVGEIPLKKFDAAVSQLKAKRDQNAAKGAVQ